VFGWIAPRDRGRDKRRCCTGSSVGFCLIHGYSSYWLAFRAWCFTCLGPNYFVDFAHIYLPLY
jgi:hypothetical protein